jgi:hypothetical protein
MIDIAARATSRVLLPDGKATRAAIINMFKAQMTKLKERLAVSPCIDNSIKT